MITLKQLSEISGISPRTVSRILNGQPKVRKDKREKVLRLAAELHYVPNISARNLRLKNKLFVGMLLERYTCHAELNQMNVLCDHLIERGLSPIMGRIRAGHETECLQMLNSWVGTVNYVIVLFMHHEEEEARLREITRDLPIQLIFADCAVYAKEWDVEVDRPSSVAQMIGVLQQRGYRRILHCGCLKNRRDGLLRAAQMPGGETLDFSYVEVRNDDAYSAGGRIMEHRPDVVFFDTDRLAASFYRYAMEKGIRIPEDVAVVGFDDEIFAEMLMPPLSTLAHPTEEVVERICDIVSTGNKPPQERLLMRFIERGSTSSL